MPMTLDDVAALVKGGELDKAARQLETVSTSAGEEAAAKKLYLKGQIHERRGEIVAAIEAYEEGLSLDPNHVDCAFRAAYLHDLRGNDERATELYEVCTTVSPVPVNALLNLSVLYEEQGRLEEAECCIQSVLDEYPEHPRAHLFMKDLDASMNMVCEDADPRQRTERLSLVDTPLSDFELSVRSRNCLKQMQINTLGDLLRISEPELLAFKNFGETSLNEIKAMLSQRGLVIGQLAASTIDPFEPLRQASYADPAAASADPAVLSQPVGSLELSVRARRCLQRLGVSTLAELIQRSEAELLSIKNFGQTSLDEIRRELGARGLNLRGLR